MTRSSKENTPAHGASTDTNNGGPSVKTTPIAIIGVGSLFPKAHSTQEYWDNILRKVDCISDVPPSRWSIEDYYDPNPAAPDKSYCKRGGFIPDIDFDPMEFGLPPNILEVTDVSQLISLVVAREALEDAGYGEDKPFDREHTGCVLGFVGMSSKLFTPLMTRLQYPVWEKVLRSAGIAEADVQKITEKMKLAYVNWEENSFPGAIGNVVSGRICNRFDLGGTNCVVDAACGSSLAAVRMAAAELIEGRANMMITGGVDTDNSINSFMCFSKTPAFSRGENVRTFDAESSGMMVGEGLGMIVLKRLADAERDGDRIYAIIQAIGTSSDGRFKSIYAPRPAGQAKAVRRAYAEAGFSPSTVGLIEAHGTGTVAGDPAEFQGINEVFSENNPRKQYIALGSVKSQIGHTKAAAGTASLIKTALALYHKVLPPTINVTRPNPKFDITNTPFYINTETRPWIRAKNGIPRRAGVSSFGFGGTNFHVVLEEYQADHSGAYRLNTVARPVLLSAPDPAQLLAACRAALHSLQGDAAAGDPSGALNFTRLAQSSRSLEIPQASARVGFVAETVEEARQALQICVDNLASKPQEASWEHPRGIYYRKNGLDHKGKVVALFSGQGSQYLEMGRELAVNFPAVREVYAAVDDLFLRDELEPLSSRVYPRPVFDAQEREVLSDALTRTEHAQPAIGSLSVGLYKLLQQAGFQPDFIAGHSFGELTALWAAGVLDENDYYALAKARGKAMSPPEDPNYDAGTMVAVKGEVEKIRAVLADDPEVTLANLNSNDQVVIAGSKQAMARAQQRLNEQGFKTIPLPVSAAFHTPLVGHAQKPFAKAVKAVKFHAPQVRVYANGTAQAHPAEPEAIREALAGHILKPVLFRDEIANIHQAGGEIFVEFGPKNVLTNLVDNILAGKPHLAVALNASPKKDSDRQLREAVIALRVAGLPLLNFDPYQVERAASAPRKKSPVTVKLNAGYYVSEKTRAAFENALKDGFKISLPQHLSQTDAAPAAPVAAPAAAGAPAPQAAQPSSPTPPQAAYPAQAVAQAPLADPASSGAFEHLIDEYQSQQSETLRLHEQYLRMEEEYARAFAQLTQLQTELVSKGAGSDLQAVVPLFESLERSMTRFHDHQAETLRVHQRYLETQERFGQSFVQNVQSSAGIHSSAPISHPAPAPLPAQPIPAPHAAPAVTPSSPAVPARVNGNGHKPAPIAEMGIISTPFTPAAAAQTNAPQPPAPEPAVAPAPVGMDDGQLKAALLAIVSEKTGYPVETLELDMDMEADLGIDSIKRVEILGGMQAQFPGLPAIDTAVLAELRTLGQIVDQFRAVVLSAPAEPAVAAAPAPAPAAQFSLAASPAAQVDAAGISRALLAIVSEKTGYPVETLEMDMDMEADLGIDSIKRVEILGALQTQFPHLPQMDTTTLAELRTLGQIVEAMGAVNAAQAAAQAVAQAPAGEAVPAQAATNEPVRQLSQALAPVNDPVQAAAPGIQVDTLSTALLTIVSEKTGYPVETLEVDMDMEADLGIDSIKRVEILGALQAQFPDLPKADAAALAELRTLGQIIAFMSGAATPAVETVVVTSLPSAGAPVAANPSVGVADSSPFEYADAELIPFDYGVEQGIVMRRILPAPDALSFDLPEGHVCLISDDGTPVTPALAHALLEKNWPVVVLRFPEAVVPGRLPLPQGAASVELAEISEPALQASLAQVAGQYGPVAAFIHLTRAGQRIATLSGEGSALGAEEGEKSLLKMAFLAAKHLKPVLNEAAEKGRAAFMTVTRLDGEFGLGEQADFTPVNGGLFGLVKTLNLEWDAVFCRAVDLSPVLETDRVVSCILAELQDPNLLVTEVGYTQNERSTLVVASIPVTAGRAHAVGGKK